MKTAIKILVICIITASMFSCKTTQKTSEEEKYVLKSELQDIKESLTYSNEEIKQDVIKYVSSYFSEKTNEFFKKFNKTETENATIKGSITPEEGKEKSFTYGSSTITSNGVTVDFVINKDKALNETFESKYTEVNKKLETLETTNATLLKKAELQDKQIANQNQKINSLTEILKKQTNKKGLTFWVVLIAILIGLGYIFKEQIPFLNKII